MLDWKASAAPFTKALIEQACERGAMLGRENLVYRDMSGGYIHPCHLLPDFAGTIELAIELEHLGLAHILPHTSSGPMVKILDREDV